jgi:hypothetical protein
MAQEIFISRKSRLIHYVIATLLGIIGIAMVIAAIYTLNEPKPLYPFVLPMGALFLGLAIYLVLLAKKWKVTITEHTFTEVSVFKAKEALIADIKGYTADDKNLYLYVNDKRTFYKFSKQIEMNPELSAWIYANLRDLDAEEMKASESAILQEDSLGSTPERRQQRLKIAKKITLAFNLTGGLTAAWFLLFPEPYEPAFLIACAIPLIALIPYYYFKGVIKMDSNKNSAYPSLAAAFIFLPLAPMLRALLDFNLLSYNNVWVPAILIGLAMSMALSFNRKAFFSSKSFAPFLLVIILVLYTGYGFAVTVISNCIYDSSIPQEYVVQVADKHSSSGKTTTYYLELEGWPGQPADDYKVDKEQYSRVQPGQTVQVYIWKGKWNIPWMMIRD